MDKFGLSSKHLKLIAKVMEKFPEIEKASIFGSRSNGNFKNGSDIDIAIFDSKITLKTLSKISYELENMTPIPLFFDLIHYDNLKNSMLKEVIEGEGQIIYLKSITDDI